MFLIFFPRQCRSSLLIKVVGKRLLWEKCRIWRLPLMAKIWVHAIFIHKITWWRDLYHLLYRHYVNLQRSIKQNLWLIFLLSSNGQNIFQWKLARIQIGNCRPRKLTVIVKLLDILSACNNYTSSIWYGNLVGHMLIHKLTTRKKYM